MSNPYLIIVAGWAYSTKDMAPLCAAFSGKYNIQVTSTAKLFSNDDTHRLPLPPASKYAMALYELITKTGKPPVVIAWSMGALVAIETVVKLKPSVSRLVLVNGTSRFCADKDYPHGIPEQNLRAMAAGLANRPEELFTAFFRDAIFPQTGRSQEIEQRTRTALSLPLEALKDGLCYLRRTDMRNALSEINAPTLIIHGSQDKIIPSSSGEFLKSQIQNSHLTLHENTGHCMILDHPAMIAEDIRSFMES